MTTILKMAAAGCLQPSVWSENVSCAGRAPLPPPYPPQEPTMWSSGDFGCVRWSSRSRSGHPCHPQVHRAKWVGKGGGTLEPLDPASLHKEKTPGAQLRSCGWQAIFHTHPVTHRPLGNRFPPSWPQGGSRQSHCRGPGTCGSWAGHTQSKPPLCRQRGPLSSGE